MASGEIIEAEQKSRTLSHSTAYWAEYTVRLNLTQEQCGPRDVWFEYFACRQIHP